MTHPSLDDILAGTAAAHVERCPACRRLAGLAGIAVAPGEPPGVAPLTAPPLADLPAVDSTLYTAWRPLDDARGGMGRVFRARDRRLDRDVAIKQLRPDLAAADRAALAHRFEREARLTARLQHPSIVGVHEAGRFDNGEPFYAMPLLRGAPLGTEIARRPTLADRLELLPHLTAVAEAIAYAHDEGIVHRDIKPANILIGTFGETVVIDWGLAKALDERGDVGGARDAAAAMPAPTGGLTQLGVGTAHYMPPEQASGEQPDARVDVYAVGATLYHLLAGVPPYGDARSTEVRRTLLDEPPPPLATLVPEVPRELAGIVDRAMARDPGQRFASARALADELRRFQTGQLLTSRRYTLGELVRHFARRHRAALRIGAVATAALVAVAVFAVLRIARERDLANANEVRAEQELHRAQGTVASSLAGEPARRLDALALAADAVGADLAIGRAPEPEALQGLLDALAAGPPVVPLAHDGHVTGFARAGDKLVGVDSHALDVWDARTGARLAALPSVQTNGAIATASRDAARVVMCGFDPVGEVFDLATGARTRFDARTDFAACGFLPDGRVIAAADDVTVRDAATLAVTARYALPARATGMAIAPSGRVAIAALDGTLWLWEPGREPVATATHLPLGIELRFSPDERTLYDNGTDQVARAFAVGDLAAPPRELAANRDGQLSLIVPSPDGTRVAVGMFDVDNHRSGVVLDLAGARPAVALAGHPLAWSDDARALIVERHGPVDIVDARSGLTELELARSDEETTPWWIGRDRIVTTSRDGATYLWDVAGAGTGMLVGHTGEIVRVAVRGDLVATASHDGSLRVWRDGREVTAIAGAAPVVAADWLDDDTLVVGDLGGGVRVVDAATGAVRARREVAGGVSALAVSRDGARIAIGGYGGAIAVTDRALAAAATAAPAAGAVTAIAFAPDGARVVSGHGDGSTRLWDAATGAAIATAPDREPVGEPDDHDADAALLVTADGARVLVARPAGTTLVLDAATLAPRGRLPGRVVGAPARDGRVALARPDGTVVVSDAAGARARVLAGHRGAVLDAVFIDDTRLVTASVDGTLRAWDLATGAEVARYTAPGLGVVTAVALAGGDAIVAGYASGAVRVYPLTARAALARACTILGELGRRGAYCAAAETASSRT